MILFQGRVYDTMLQGELLGQLEARINDTRLGRGLEQERVIRGLVRLGQELREELENAAPGKTAGEAGNPWIPAWLGCLTRFLSREWLEYKIETELGVKAGKGRKSEPGGSTECGPGPSHEVYHYTELQKMETHILPLGTLLHITAGNMEGLPVFSIVEGLLTGNVNILKLPGNDGGLSMDIILRLIRLEPALADYIYVFDTSSGDLPAMRRLEEMADGIVVWGGDSAVAAVRRSAPPGTRLIEWGHKLGFVYISGYECKDKELSALAEHIVSTRQLLCSSCQTIFLDTERMDDVNEFCREFLPYMERAVLSCPGHVSLLSLFQPDILQKDSTVRPVESRFGSVNMAEAALALQQHNDRMEQMAYGKKKMRKLYPGKGCSLTACGDHELELSPMFGNCLVKRLPQGQLFGCLRRHKRHLQTAGLICREDRRTELMKTLASGGVARITRAGTMSSPFAGEAHDGEYALRRYVRFVSQEM